MSLQSKMTSFKPREHGFHFSNATLNMCGGMCWAALDRYFAGERVPDRTTPPRPDEALYRELFRRQTDSFHGTEIPQKFLEWQLCPDQSDPRNPIYSVGYMTQTLEWPRVRSKLDEHVPSTLGLLRVYLGDPRQNHQVVATGYTYDTDTKKVEITIYDPNHPDSNVSIGITLEQANGRLNAWQSTGETLRGFFLIPYDRQERVITEGQAGQGQTEPVDDISWLWPLFSGS